MPVAHRVHRDPRDTLEERLSWRDWRPVFLAALVALVLGGALILLFDQVSPYQRDDALRALSGSVCWLVC
jgi:hypothetical protein